MKKTTKRLGVFVMALLIAFTNLGGPVTAYAAQNKNTTVEGAVDVYMNARADVLKKEKMKDIEEVSVSGIISDELEHRAFLEELNLTFKSSTYEISETEQNDTYVEVSIVETVTYVEDKEKKTCEVAHQLVLMQDDSGNWLVVSDAYVEGYSNFASCSYVVVDEYAIDTCAVSLVPTIVSVAQSQVGYKEKASNSNLYSFTANAGSANYSKYGAWYGTNPGAWCAMFVSWCANQAGISNSMLPKFENCTSGMAKFKNMGRFYYSSTYGGSYTPKAGDIFFTGTSKTASGHTGIVVSVSGTTMTVIDGNCGNQVKKHTMSTKDSSLIGFATSCKHSSVLKYNVSYHWKECSMCGTAMSLEQSHTYSSTGKCTTCGAVKASTASLALE